MKRLNIFYHHIYELKKGLRNLILFTTSRANYPLITRKLESNDIEYLIYPVAKEGKRINVFFGSKKCIEVLKKINKRRLADFNAEEDFLLGIMLGYDRLKQCERYLRLKERDNKLNKTTTNNESIQTKVILT